MIENQIEMNTYRERDTDMNKIGKMNINDFLLMLAGVATIAVITMVLSWIIL